MNQNIMPRKKDISGDKEKDVGSEKIRLTRRQFLKGMMALVAGAATEPIVRKSEIDVDLLEKMLTGRTRKNDAKKEVSVEDKTEKNSSEFIDQTIIKEDAISVRDLVNFDSRKPIKIGQAEIEGLKKYWEKRYEGDKKSDLDGALIKMKDWEASASEEFMRVGEAFCRKNNMNQEEANIFLKEFKTFFYLSIPESYWRLNDKSGANAVGPFQFIEDTGAYYGLKFDKKTEKIFDERRDPIKSAKAAGQFLLDLYEKMNHDWDLALSGYNGGFAGRFRKEALANGQELNYLKFLEYMGKKIERLRRELTSVITLTHEVLKGDTAEKIASLYGMTEKQLKLMNKYENLDTLEPEDKLVIIPTMENRRKNFYYHIEGFSQNINYPAKLQAVLAVLEKRKKATGRDCLNQESNLPKWKELPIRQEKLYFKYVVKRGETLSTLVAKFKLKEDEICLKNGLVKGVKLKAGMEFDVRNKNKPKTLYSLAGSDSKKLVILELLNPAIKDAKVALPDGIVIRYPVSDIKSYLAGK